MEKKGDFRCLSWPCAATRLHLADTAATWEVRRIDGLPSMATDLGVIVEVGGGGGAE
jgi:hypothetical protein